MDFLSDFDGRLIRDVQILGLEKVQPRLVENQIRAKPGQPFSAEIVRDDIKRLNRLGRFKEINAKIQPFDDQSVSLIYEFKEAPVITDVLSVGNRQISDQEIAAILPPLAGTPVDEFELSRCANRIKDLYRKKGYYLAEVTVDQSELSTRGVVIFQIRERDRIKVTDIRFRGNEHFDSELLRPIVHTKVAGLFEAGPLDDDVLDQDVATIVNFYKDRGYLDIRADREVQPSPDGKEAIVTFVVDEGQQFTLRSVRAELGEGRGGAGAGKPPTVLTTEQIAGLMLIKTGDAFSVEKLNKSIKGISDAYGQMGYYDVKVNRAELRDPTKPEVDLLIVISEGKRFITGLLPIAGNELTQQKVVRRELDPLRPQRPTQHRGHP